MPVFPDFDSDEDLPFELDDMPQEYWHVRLFTMDQETFHGFFPEWSVEKAELNHSRMFVSELEKDGWCLLNKVYVMEEDARFGLEAQTPVFTRINIHTFDQLELERIDAIITERIGMYELPLMWDDLDQGETEDDQDDELI